MLEDAWEPGAVYRTSIKEYGGYWLLASYIVQKPNEEVWQQLSLFPSSEQKQLCEHNCSRNLKEPKPQRSRADHWTMRLLLEAGSCPITGYYIKQDSIVCGVNLYIGISYDRYTKVRIHLIKGGDKPQKEGKRNEEN